MQDVALFGINNFWIINNDFIMRNMTVEYLRVIFIFLIVLLHILWKDYGGLHIMSYNQSIESYIQLGLTNLTSLGVYRLCSDFWLLWSQVEGRKNCFSLVSDNNLCIDICCVVRFVGGRRYNKGSC